MAAWPGNASRAEPGSGGFSVASMIPVLAFGVFPICRDVCVQGGEHSDRASLTWAIGYEEGL